MRRLTEFPVQVLNDDAVTFVMRVKYNSKQQKIFMGIDRHSVLETIQSLKDQSCEKIDLYWSSAPIAKQVAQELLNDRSIAWSDKLHRFTLRSPYCEAYSFRKRDYQQ